MDERRKLEQTIAALEARLADLEARVPAHSIPPGIIAEMDELDEQLAKARQAGSAGAPFMIPAGVKAAVRGLNPDLQIAIMGQRYIRG